MPRRASSMAMLASASRERWKPGTTTTSGARLSLVAEIGRNRSPTTHCPFCVGILIDWTRMSPNDVCTSDAPRLEISATDLRARAATGRSIRYLVPEPVRAYVAEHGLYLERPARPEPTTGRNDP